MDLIRQKLAEFAADRAEELKAAERAKQRVIEARRKARKSKVKVTGHQRKSKAGNEGSVRTHQRKLTASEQKAAIAKQLLEDTHNEQANLRRLNPGRAPRATDSK